MRLLPGYPDGIVASRSRQVLRLIQRPEIDAAIWVRPRRPFPKPDVTSSQLFLFATDKLARHVHIRRMYRQVRPASFHLDGIVYRLIIQPHDTTTEYLARGDANYAAFRKRTGKICRDSRKIRRLPARSVIIFKGFHHEDVAQADRGFMHREPASTRKGFRSLAVAQILH